MDREADYLGEKPSSASPWPGPSARLLTSPLAFFMYKVGLMSLASQGDGEA